CPHPFSGGLSRIGVLSEPLSAQLYIFSRNEERRARGFQVESISAFNNAGDWCWTSHVARIART
ncbi:MAG: hypothetical protein AAF085_14560, partial [Planctomycetota bacterium]